ncbi:hypothetical protein [Streptomyces fructofermentans]|uniref:hypothetical protein n=1 Tax=Streptomyces fructofermentans TaxID=152141 RepID=UPI0033F9E906
MNTDAALRPDAEAGWAERVAAFENAGRKLRRLAADGRLIRGIRGVLAHHAIFAFNRAGVPVDAQVARPSRRLLPRRRNCRVYPQVRPGGP